MTPLPATRLARRLGRGRNAVAWLAVLVIAGFALRWSLARVETLMGSDACHYLLLAEGLASGRGYSSGGSEHPDVTRLPVFPMLLAPLGAATGDFETSARFLVTLAGALLPLPFWWLARRAFGPDAAWLASLLAAFSCVHGASGFLLPDPIALLLLLASAAAAAEAARRPAWRRWLLTGALAALAAWTRSEAILLPPLVAAAVAVGSRRRRLAGAFVVLGCATVLYAPYVAWASSKLGRFAPAPGVEYVLDARGLSDRLGLRWIGDPSVSWNDKARYMLDRGGDRLLLDAYFLEDRLPDLTESPTVAPPHADARTPGERTRDELFRRWRILVGNLTRIPSLLGDEHLTPPGPWALAIVGGLVALARRSARRSVPVLLAAGAASLVPYASHVEPRFGYSVFAGTIVLAAGGWGWLAIVLRGARAPLRVGLHALVLASILLPALAHDPRAGTRSTRRLTQRQLGVDASRALPPGSLMAIRPLVPYFAGRPYLELPIASPDRVLDFARRRGAAGIVLEGSVDRAERPELAAWFGDGDPPGLRRVALRDDPDGGRFLVYAVEPGPR